MQILVTGGAGYIGSHTTLELLQAGHDVVVVDNLVNSSQESLRRVEELAGKAVTFVEADADDSEALGAVFADHSFDAVIHFAGLKAVGESTKQPLAYYRNNIDSTLTLLDQMQQHGITKLIFSSSATVYGNPAELPLTEESQTGIGITNPYGWTKYMIEQMLRDVAAANPEFSVTTLRYFNPVGAHESGRIGEDPSGIPNNLMPYVAQVAIGKRPELTIFGNDYDTPDGTCIRDFIHVVDLAKGHLAALEHMQPGYNVYNLGSGKGTSVLELVAAFEQASGKKIPYTFGPRRAGDVVANYASADKAARELGWHTEKRIADACRDTWNWQSNNPNGFNTEEKS